MIRRFMQLDVFAGRPFGGNPLAVVLDGESLDDAAMQAYARWSNLSETTFLLPPTDAEADYRVRIFTPSQELPFAGHPTLGSAYAWLAAGGLPKRGDRVVQQCGIGRVPLRRDGDALAFAAPPRRRSGPLADDEIERLCSALHIARADVVAHEWVDNGPPWRALLLRDAAAVRALRPVFADAGDAFVGVVGACAAGDDAAFEVRAFFPGANGVAEDPVTGSLNAGLGQWLIGAGLAPARYVARQGTALGCDGRVLVERDADGAVWVGGPVHRRIDGTVEL
jgi:PhzF family phenazine biosynthesis protein